MNRGGNSMFNYGSNVNSGDSMKGMYGSGDLGYIPEAAAAGPANPFPFQNSGGTNPTYFVDRDLKISHLELMVGGNIPESISEKDDLIRRLRIFISKLNVNLEQSEDKHKLLKKELSKKNEEVKESEELVRQLTSTVTNQATAVAQQIKEVEKARESFRGGEGGVAMAPQQPILPAVMSAGNLGL